MRFGKIQYLNLVPFDVFVKSYPLHSRFKLAAFARKSYPAKLNQAFFFRRIDAGFISTIAGYKSHYKRKATCAGIIAKGAVWSVLAIDEGESTCSPSDPESSARATPLHPNATKRESVKKDYQSDTSNILGEVLGLRGSVLIGDRALAFRFSGGQAVDMGQCWWDRHGLPFVFGRLCYNSYAALYTKLARAFIKKRVKIPHYILRERASESKIPSSYIREYLGHIHYAIGAKERASIDRFYRAVRLRGLKPPSRIYAESTRARSQLHSSIAITQQARNYHKTRHINNV